MSSWQYQTGTQTISSQSASYDALGRLTYWSALATATLPAASTSYGYDANSNIRRSVATFRTLDQYGAPGPAGTQDYWYRYDAMNRVVTAKGILSGGAIARGSQGVDIYYDVAGQRTQTVTQFTGWATTSVVRAPVLGTAYVIDAGLTGNKASLGRGRRSTPKP
ncbi:hypothetical protein FHR20_001131 [Sphingomonas leidyi]|uniref:RHS repeat protein n=1 Tax=Sphingomonas leidyi TaxID=68569 RepID=A0A7X5ZUM7_9SPHN|nr:hypothetical protein [Sphingomonas leidyi]